MQNAKKQLQSLSNDLKKISTKVEKLLAELGPEKPPAKAKPKASAKKPAQAKAAAKTTAADTVYAIIKRSRKGVDIRALKQKTGFEDKKIHNVIYKLKKQNKIKSASKGVYTAT